LVVKKGGEGGKKEKKRKKRPPIWILNLQHLTMQKKGE
jgi:hypothetical protein